MLPKSVLNDTSQVDMIRVIQQMPVDWALFDKQELPNLGILG